MDFTQNASNGQQDPSSSLRRERVSLQKEAQNDRDDLSGGRDRGTNQGIKVRDSVKDEGLSHGRTARELHDQGQYFGMRRAKCPPFPKVSNGQRDDEGHGRHAEIGVEHEIVGFGCQSDPRHVRLQSFLHASGDSIHDEGEHDEKDSQRCRFASLLCLFDNRGRHGSVCVCACLC